MTASEANPHRLPRTALPSRYEITLSPDLDQRDFVGQVVVHLDVREPVAELVCNAADLTIDKAWVTDDSGARNPASATLDATRERVTFSFDRVVRRGPAKLHIQYHGKFNENLCGMYASTYEADDGTQKVIAATQCQPTDARRVFPCWDEPDLKSVFAITLIIDDRLTAISNGAELGSSVTGSGKRMVRFSDTMVMSSYLVCIVVGDLHVSSPVDVDGVPLRVVCVPGKEHLASFALETGAFALKYFTSYYGIAYPDRKLDLIALPDFAAGAMENVGAVTFRETLLLVDEGAAPRVDLERVADVISHEIAHMWFGDLVTMRWWNGIWLNEAFATFMEVSCVDAFRPDWQRWTGFSLYRSAAFAVDGLQTTRTIEYPVLSPVDAEGMFDVLTYEKGAAVLRMLEQYLGEDRFRNGVRRYLNEHAHGNTETTDLWDALEAETGEPVRAMMDSWIFQAGHPVIDAELEQGADGQPTVYLHQQRFSYLPAHSDTRWHVPVLWRHADASAQQAGSAGRTMLTNLDHVAIGPAGDAAFVVNAGSHGFYRVRYDSSLLSRLTLSLRALNETERFSLIADTWASVLAGTALATEYLELVAKFGEERSPEVWRTLMVGFTAINNLVGQGAARERLRERVTRLAAPILEEIGWDSAPSGDSARTAELRGVLVEALGVVAAHRPTQDRANALLERLLADTPEGPDADLVPAVIRIGAATGDAARYEKYIHAQKRAAAPQDAIRYLYARGAFADPVLVQRTLDAALTDEVRGQDTPYLIRDMLAGADSAALTWRFLAQHWDALVARIPSNSVVRMLEPLAMLALVDPAAADDALAFFAPDGGKQIPQGGKQLAQHLERLMVNVAWRNRERDAIDMALARPGQRGVGAWLSGPDDAGQAR